MMFSQLSRVIWDNIIFFGLPDITQEHYIPSPIVSYMAI